MTTERKLNVMVRLRIIAVTGGLLLLGGVGCQNDCQELAGRICDRASVDLDSCAGVQADEEKKAACQRIKDVSLSCRDLTEKADSATAKDKEACGRDLELIRALERQQQ